mmetsp:Transcript_8309/g.18578  ORF Transcript_8309/g.18578 Transcript_8309/m.18578 type:complete len:212 (-) Transcript_8309:1046-1681(-)
MPAAQGTSHAKTPTQLLWPGSVQSWCIGSPRLLSRSCLRCCWRLAAELPALLQLLLHLCVVLKLSRDVRLQGRIHCVLGAGHVKPVLTGRVVGHQRVVVVSVQDHLVPSSQVLHASQAWAIDLIVAARCEEAMAQNSEFMPRSVRVCPPGHRKVALQPLNRVKPRLRPHAQQPHATAGALYGEIPKVIRLHHSDAFTELSVSLSQFVVLDC